MMSEQEMIEVLEAYSRGEKIEFFDSESRIRDWKQAPTPSWDFSRWRYRIKPKETLQSPFKKGGYYIYKNRLNPFFVDTLHVFEVLDVREDVECIKAEIKIIRFEGTQDWEMSDDDIKDCKENYINIYDDSLLWYWEYEDKEDGYIAYTSFRKSYKEALEWCKKTNDSLLYPVFSLGCVRDEKDKESK